MRLRFTTALLLTGVLLGGAAPVTAHAAPTTSYAAPATYSTHAASDTTAAAAQTGKQKPKPKPSKKKKKKGTSFGLIGGIIAVAFVLVLLITFLAMRRRRT